MLSTFLTQNYKDFIQMKKQAAEKETRPEKKEAILLDCFTTLLTKRVAYNLDRTALFNVVSFGLEVLPAQKLIEPLKHLLNPDNPSANPEKLDTEERLSITLQAIRQSRVLQSNVKEQTFLEECCLLQYFEKNTLGTFFKHNSTRNNAINLSNAFYNVFDKYSYNHHNKTISTPENTASFTLLLTGILKSAINYGQASFIQDLHPQLEKLCFFENLLKSFTIEQQQSFEKLLKAKASDLVTEIIQEYTDGETGCISPETAQLDLSCRAARKTYTYNNITIVENELRPYLFTLKSANYPLAEYFIITGNHWISGYIEITKNGDCKILLLDSLGKTDEKRFGSTNGYYPSTEHHLHTLQNFQPTLNSTIEIYFAPHVRQKSGTGCRIYALDDIARLHTLTQYMPEPYKNKSIFDYLDTHTVAYSNRVHFVDLPFALMRSTQTSNPAEFLEKRPEEAAWPVNKKNQPAITAITSTTRQNIHSGKTQNFHIQTQVAKKTRQILDFIWNKTPEEMKALRKPYTLQKMIERLTTLTVLTQHDWNIATPTERLHHLQDIFEKLEAKAQRLGTETLQLEIKKYAELAFLHLDKNQTKQFFEKMMADPQYMKPLTKSDLFNILFALCKSNINSVEISDHLLKIYLKNNSATLLLSENNESTKQYLKNALQRFTHTNNTDHAELILQALVCYIIQNHHAELCNELKDHPLQLAEPQKNLHQQLLQVMDPPFVTTFMKAYRQSPFGTPSPAHLQITLARYAESAPLRATVITRAKALSRYFSDFAAHHSAQPEYFLIGENNHWVAGMLSYKENGEAELVLLDAYGRNLQGKLSNTAESILYAFQKHFPTDDLYTHIAYITETIRHNDAAPTWMFAVRDLKKLCSLTQEELQRLKQQIPSHSHNLSGLDVKTIELLPCFSAMSKRQEPGAALDKKRKKIVAFYYPSDKSDWTLLRYKLIRQAQKMLNFIVNKTEETVDAYAAAHTVEGYLTRREHQKFSHSSVASSETAVTDGITRERNLSISLWNASKS